MITVTNEKEAYHAITTMKSGTIYFSPGIYQMGRYLAKIKRIKELSFRKKKSQNRRR